MKSIKSLLTLWCCLIAAPFALDAKVLTTAQAQANLDTAIAAFKKDQTNPALAQQVLNSYAPIQGAQIKANADAKLKKELGKTIKQVEQIVTGAKAAEIKKSTPGISTSDAAAEAEVQEIMVLAKNLLDNYDDQGINSATLNDINEYYAALTELSKRIDGSPYKAKLAETQNKLNAQLSKVTIRIATLSVPAPTAAPAIPAGAPVAPPAAPAAIPAAPPAPPVPAAAAPGKGKSDYQIELARIKPLVKAAYDKALDVIKKYETANASNFNQGLGSVSTTRWATQLEKENALQLIAEVKKLISEITALVNKVDTKFNGNLYDMMHTSDIYIDCIVKADRDKEAEQWKEQKADLLSFIARYNSDVAGVEKLETAINAYTPKGTIQRPEIISKYTEPALKKVEDINSLYNQVSKLNFVTKYSVTAYASKDQTEEALKKIAQIRKLNDEIPVILEPLDKANAHKPFNQFLTGDYFRSLITADENLRPDEYKQQEKELQDKLNTYEKAMKALDGLEKDANQRLQNIAADEAAKKGAPVAPPAPPVATAPAAGKVTVKGIEVSDEMFKSDDAAEVSRKLGELADEDIKAHKGQIIKALTDKISATSDQVQKELIQKELAEIEKI